MDLSRDLLDNYAADQTQPTAPAAPPPEPAFNIIGKAFTRSQLEASDAGKEYLATQDAVGRRGFVEAVTDIGSEQIPFVGAVMPIKDILSVRGTFKRLANGDDVPDEERIRAAAYWAGVERQSQQGTVGMVGDILRQMPTFMAEIGAYTAIGSAVAPVVGTAGGAATAVGKKLASIVARRLAKGAGEEAVQAAMAKFLSDAGGHALTKYGIKVATAATETGIKGAGWGVMNAGVKAAANIAAGNNATDTITGAQRMLSNTLSGSDESDNHARMLGLGSEFIEYFSEASGPFLGELLPVGKALGAVAKRTGLGEGTNKFLMGAATRLGMDAKDAQRLVKAGGTGALISELSLKNNWSLDRAFNFLKTVGYDGMVEEMGEERFGGFLQGLFGMQGDDKGGLRNAFDQMIPDTEQLKAEAIAFAVPTVTVMAVNRGKIAARGGIGKFTQQLRTIQSGTRPVSEGEVITMDDTGEVVPQDQLAKETADPTQVARAVQDYVETFMTSKPEGYLGKIVDGALNVVEAIATGSLSQHPGIRGGMDLVLSNTGRQPLAAYFLLHRNSALKQMQVDDVKDATPEQLEKANEAARNVVIESVALQREAISVSTKEVKSILDEAKDAFVKEGKPQPAEKDLVDWVNKRSTGPDAIFAKIKTAYGVSVWVRRNSPVLNPQGTDEAMAGAAKKLLGRLYDTTIVIDKDANKGPDVERALKSLTEETRVEDLEAAANDPFTANGLRLLNVTRGNLVDADGVKRFKSLISQLAKRARLAAQPTWIDGNGAAVSVVGEPGSARVVPLNPAGADIVAGLPVKEGPRDVVEGALKGNLGLTRITDTRVRLTPSILYTSKDPVSLAASFSYGFDASKVEKSKQVGYARDFILNVLRGGFDPKTGVYSVTGGGYNSFSGGLEAPARTIYMAAASSPYHVTEEMYELGAALGNSLRSAYARSQKDDTEATLAQAGSSRARVRFLNAVVEHLTQAAEKDEAAQKLVTLASIQDRGGHGREFMSKLAALYFSGFDFADLRIPYKAEFAKHMTAIVTLPEFSHAMQEYMAGIGATDYAGKRLDSKVLEALLNPDLTPEQRSSVMSRITGFQWNKEVLRDEEPPAAPVAEKKPASPPPVAPPAARKPSSAPPPAAPAAEKKPAAPVAEKKPVAPPPAAPAAEKPSESSGSAASVDPSVIEDIDNQFLMNKPRAGRKADQGVDDEETPVKGESISIYERNPEIVAAHLEHTLFSERKRLAGEAGGLPPELQYDPKDMESFTQVLYGARNMKALADKGIPGLTKTTIANAVDALIDEQASKALQTALAAAVASLRAAAQAKRHQADVKEAAGVDAEDRQGINNDVEVEDERARDSSLDASAFDKLVATNPSVRFAKDLFGVEVGHDRAFTTLAKTIVDNKLLLNKNSTPEDVANHPLRSEAAFKQWWMSPSATRELALIKQAAKHLRLTAFNDAVRHLAPIEAMELPIAYLREDDRGTSVLLKSNFKGTRDRELAALQKSAVEHLLALSPADRQQLLADAAAFLDSAPAADTPLARRADAVMRLKDFLVRLAGTERSLTWFGDWMAKASDKDQVWGKVADVVDRLRFWFRPTAAQRVSDMTLGAQGNDDAWRRFVRRNSRTALRTARYRGDELLENPLATLWSDYSKELTEAPERVTKPNGGTASPYDMHNWMHDTVADVRKTAGEPDIKLVKLAGMVLSKVTPNEDGPETVESRNLNDSDMTAADRNRLMRATWATSSQPAMFIPMLGDKSQAYAMLVPRKLLFSDGKAHTFEEAYAKMAAMFYDAAIKGATQFSSTEWNKRSRIQSSGGARLLVGVDGGMGQTFKMLVFSGKTLDGHARVIGPSIAQMQTSLASPKQRIAKMHYLGTDTAGNTTLGKTSWVLDAGEEGSSEYKIGEELSKLGYLGYTDEGGFKAFSKAKEVTVTIDGQPLTGWEIELYTDALNETTHLEHQTQTEVRRMPHPSIYDMVHHPGGREALQVYSEYAAWVAREVAPKLARSGFDLVNADNDRIAYALLAGGLEDGFPLVLTVAQRAKIAAVAETLFPHGWGEYAMVLPSATPLDKDIDDKEWLRRGIADYGFLKDGKTQSAWVRMNVRGPGIRHRLRIKSGKKVMLPASVGATDRMEVPITADLVGETIIKYYAALRKSEDAEPYRAMLREMLVDSKGQKPSDTVSYEDLLDIGDLNDSSTWSFMAHEVRDIDGEQWLPGSWARMDRTPGGDMHAHVMVRISDPVTWFKTKTGKMVAGTGNYLMAHPQVISRGGIDFDGDMSNVHMFRVDKDTGLIVRQYDGEDVEMRRSSAGNDMLFAQLSGYQRIPRENLLSSIDKEILDGVHVYVKDADGATTKVKLGDAAKLGKKIPLSALQKASFSMELAERARASTQSRGIIVAEYRRFQYLLRVGKVGFGAVAASWPGGELLSYRDKEDPARDKLLHNLLQNVLNIIIDDISEPRASYLGLDEISLPFFTTLAFGQDFKSQADVVKFVQQWVEYAHSPVMQKYRQGRLENPFTTPMQREKDLLKQRPSTITPADWSKNVKDLFQISQTNQEISSLASYVTQLYNRPKDYNDFVRVGEAGTRATAGDFGKLTRVQAFARSSMFNLGTAVRRAFESAVFSPELGDYAIPGYRYVSDLYARSGNPDAKPTKRMSRTQQTKLLTAMRELPLATALTQQIPEDFLREYLGGYYAIAQNARVPIRTALTELGADLLRNMLQYYEQQGIEDNEVLNTLQAATTKAAYSEPADEGDVPVMLTRPTATIRSAVAAFGLDDEKLAQMHRDWDALEAALPGYTPVIQPGVLFGRDYKGVISVPPAAVKPAIVLSMLLSSGVERLAKASSPAVAVSAAFWKPVHEAARAWARANYTTDKAAFDRFYNSFVKESGTTKETIVYPRKDVVPDVAAVPYESKGVRRLAIIGTAGRQEALTKGQWAQMLAEAEKRVRPTDILVSGGAAWADQLAVELFLGGKVAGLHLHLPAPIRDGQYVPQGQAAETAIKYHQKFKAITGVDGVARIQEAISKGAQITEEPANQSNKAFFARNAAVAREATEILAFTKSATGVPADGGTQHTWELSKAPVKQHVNIGAFSPVPAAAAADARRATANWMAKKAVAAAAPAAPVEQPREVAPYSFDELVAMRSAYRKVGDITTAGVVDSRGRFITDEEHNRLLLAAGGVGAPAEQPPVVYAGVDKAAPAMPVFTGTGYESLQALMQHPIYQSWASKGFRDTRPLLADPAQRRAAMALILLDDQAAMLDGRFNQGVWRRIEEMASPDYATNPQVYMDALVGTPELRTLVAMTKAPGYADLRAGADPRIVLPTAEARQAAADRMDSWRGQFATLMRSWLDTATPAQQQQPAPALPQQAEGPYSVADIFEALPRDIQNLVDDYGVRAMGTEPTIPAAKQVAASAVAASKMTPEEQAQVLRAISDVVPSGWTGGSSLTWDNAVTTTSRNMVNAREYNARWRPIFEGARDRLWAKDQIEKLIERTVMPTTLASKMRWLSRRWPERAVELTRGVEAERVDTFPAPAAAPALESSVESPETQAVLREQDAEATGGSSIAETPAATASRLLDTTVRSTLEQPGAVEQAAARRALGAKWSPTLRAVEAAGFVEDARGILEAAVRQKVMDIGAAHELLKSVEAHKPFADRAAYRHLALSDEAYLDSRYNPLRKTDDWDEYGRARNFGDGSSVVFFAEQVATWLHPHVLRGAPALGKMLMDEAGWLAQLTGGTTRWYDEIMKEWGLFGEGGGILRIKESGETEVFNAITGQKEKAPMTRYSASPIPGTRYADRLTEDELQLLLLAHSAGKMALEILGASKVPDYKEKTMKSRVRINLPLSETKMLYNTLPKSIADEIVRRRDQVMRDLGIADPDNIDLSTRQKYATTLRDAGVADFQILIPESATGERRLKDWEPRNLIWSVPVQLIEDTLQASSAKAKLVKAGRAASRLSVRELARQSAERFEQLYQDINEHAPSMLGGDAPFLRHRSGYAPHLFGMGFLGLKEASILDYVDAHLKQVTKEREATYQSVLSVAHDRGGMPKPLDNASEKMLRYMFDLKGLPWPGSKAAAISQIRGSQYVGLGLHPGMTMADIVSEIHKDTMNLLMQRAVNKANAEEMRKSVGDIENPLELAKATGRMMSSFKNREFSARTRSRNFNTYDEAYNKAGLVHDNVGVIDSVRRYTDDIGMQVRKEILLNQMALLKNPDGSPMVILDPVSEFEGENVIKDLTWDLHTRALAEWLGHKIDPNKSTKDNLHDMIDRYIVKNRRYQPVDSGHASVARYYAFTNGRAQENVMDMIAGSGEVGNMIKHITGESWNDPWGLLDTASHINMWMKTIALQGSLFFPVAGVESLVAATSGKVMKQMSGRGNMSVWEFRQLMRGNHPYMAELQRLAESVNIEFAHTENPMGVPVTVIDKDIERVATEARRLSGARAEKTVRALGGLMHGNTKFVFEDVFNTMKLWFVHRVLVEEREQAKKAGVPFDAKEVLGRWANDINDSLGGQPTARYSWLTPTIRKVLGLSMFSYQWSLSAWNIAGGGLLTSQVLKNYTTPQSDKFVFLKNWPAMIAFVMIGVPAALQAMMYMIGGNDDDDAKNMVDRAKQDTPWLWKNEPGRKFYADITPIVRNAPWYKGAPTGDRRFYIHWGKQSWEIMNWFENPYQNATGKLSQVARLAIEQATGESAGLGWDLGFKDMGLLGLIMDKNGGFSGSRLGNIAGKFAPFSILAAAQNADAAPLQFIAPISKGISFNRAAEAYVGFLRTWADRETYQKVYKSRKVQANLQSIGSDILLAAERNGYEPKKVIDAAKAAVLKEQYARIYKALDAKDVKAIEEAGYAIARLNGTVEGVRRSVKNRNQLYGKPATLSPEQQAVLQEAFKNP